MKAQFDNDALLLIPKESYTLDELVEAVKYYIQFLPPVGVEIRSTALRDKQEIKFSPVTEEAFKDFIKETQISE